MPGRVCRAVRWQATSWPAPSQWRASCYFRLTCFAWTDGRVQGTPLASNLMTSAIMVAGERLRKADLLCRGGCAGQFAGEQLHNQRHNSSGRARAVPRGRTTMAGGGGHDRQRAPGEEPLAICMRLDCFQGRSMVLPVLAWCHRDSAALFNQHHAYLSLMQPMLANKVC